MSRILVRDDRWMDFIERNLVDHEAIANARVGACIVFKNEIVSFQTNQLKTHPLQTKFGRNKEAIYLHAEVASIVAASKRIIHPNDWKKSTIYVLRLTKNEDRAIAKPCSGCTQAIAAYGIGRVVYTGFDGETIVVD
jgi:deoxycytidylate deaminase